MFLSPEALRARWPARGWDWGLGSWEPGEGPGQTQLPHPPLSLHLHGTGRIAGIAALHILHLAGVYVWDGHLLELLHLGQRKGTWRVRRGPAPTVLPLKGWCPPRLSLTLSSQTPRVAYGLSTKHPGGGQGWGSGRAVSGGEAGTLGFDWGQQGWGLTGSGGDPRQGPAVGVKVGPQTHGQDYRWSQSLELQKGPQGAGPGNRAQDVRGGAWGPGWWDRTWNH